MALKDVKLPDIGEGVTEGELVKWLVKVGDSVKADQPVAELMTDKATVEVPSPFAGQVKELKAKEGDTIPIETTILILESSVEAKSGTTPSAATTMAAKGQSSSSVVRATAAPSGASASGMEVYPPAAESRVLATPATRRLAREMLVDINQISGSGLAGRVTRDDVIHAKGGGAGMPGQGAVTKSLLPLPKTFIGVSASAGDERVPLKGVRKKIAENMQMAKHIIPHFTLVDEADVTQLTEMRSAAKAQSEKYGVKVTYLPFVIKALIQTVREFPMFNASIDDQAAEIVYKKTFNIGFAADTPNGLLVPAVKAAESKSLLQISSEIQELAGKARSGKLALEEMKGATITITNIGSVGGLYATPIINHPEVAILGMYKVQERPHWNGSAFVPKKMMNFSITCDHRLIDGAVAANFMKSFVQRIENPSLLMLEMI